MLEAFVFSDFQCQFRASRKTDDAPKGRKRNSRFPHGSDLLELENDDTRLQITSLMTKSNLKDPLREGDFFTFARYMYIYVHSVWTEWRCKRRDKVAENIVKRVK